MILCSLIILCNYTILFLDACLLIERHHLPKFTPHTLRHTNASLLIAGGMNLPTVARRLGHSSVSTTMKIYLHAIQATDAIASDILADKLDPFNALNAD